MRSTETDFTETDGEPELALRFLCSLSLLLLNPSGLRANVPGTTVQWFKFRLDPSGTLSYYRHDRIYDSAVNCASDILLGFSGSSANTNINAYYVWRPAFGPFSEPPVQFIAGEGHFGSDRWGDYSFTCIDPTDTSVFWTVHEYSEQQIGPSPISGTRIAKIARH